MFPAPTTIAISTPWLWSSAISPAMRSTSWRSTPYSLSPIRASPESFSRTRLNAGLPLCSACKGAALILEGLELVLLERLRDGLARIVDPLLVGQDALAEEALREHALDDLLAVLLGPGLHLGELREDLALGRQVLLGDLAARSVDRRGKRDVHRQQPCDLGRALAPDEDPDLVRGRVDVRGQDLVVALLLEARRACDDDVLAQLADELLSLVLQGLHSVRPLALDFIEHALRERPELSVLRDGLRLAADRDERAVRLRHPSENYAFWSLAARALPGLGHSPLPEELLRGLQVGVRLLQRALRVHHRSPGLIAELLHEGRGDLSHRPVSLARRPRSRPRFPPAPSARARRGAHRPPARRLGPPAPPPGRP